MSVQVLVISSQIYLPTRPRACAGSFKTHLGLVCMHPRLFLHMEMGRIASWPEHPSDCPILTPSSLLSLEPTALASYKSPWVPVPQGHSFIVNPSLQLTAMGRGMPGASGPPASRGPSSLVLSQRRCTRSAT